MNHYQQMLKKLETIIKTAAEAELLPRFRQIERFHKADGSIVTEADYAMQHHITAELQNQWPEIPLLGEEMEESEQNRFMQNSDAKLWVLDPLDGTSNFAAGIPCFAVSVALIANQKVELAVIYTQSVWDLGFRVFHFLRMARRDDVA